MKETNMSYYEILKSDKIIVEGVPLYRIRATKNTQFTRIGQLGGYIEGEHNLPQDAEEPSWVHDTLYPFSQKNVGILKAFKVLPYQGREKELRSLSVTLRSRKEERQILNSEDYGKRFVGVAKVLGNSVLRAGSQVSGNVTIRNTELFDSKVSGYLYIDDSIVSESNLRGMGILCNAKIFDSKLRDYFRIINTYMYQVRFLYGHLKTNDCIIRDLDREIQETVITGACSLYQTKIRDGGIIHNSHMTQADCRVPVYVLMGGTGCVEFGDDRGPVNVACNGHYFSYSGNDKGKLMFRSSFIKPTHQEVGDPLLLKREFQFPKWKNKANELYELFCRLVKETKPHRAYLSKFPVWYNNELE